MYAANQIAKYFLALCNADEGDFLSNLKLQKLLITLKDFIWRSSASACSAKT